MNADRSANHEEQKALAATYVLGALDAEERRSFESHLASCPECAAEVRSLQPVIAGLALAVPPRTPRAELRERVLAAIRATEAGRPPAGTHLHPNALQNARWGPRLKVRPYGVHWLPLAAMLLLTVGVGAYAARLHLRVVDLEARLEQAIIRAANAEGAMADARRVALEAQQAMAVLAAPDLARIELAGQPAAPNATGRALWSRQRGMVFIASNLPPPSAGKVYQVWVVPSGPPISAGLLTPDASGRGDAVFNTPPDIPAPVAVAVTLEPAGGVPAPTGPMYLIGRPSVI
jgi:anti-sigma-K factor RskA